MRLMPLLMISLIAVPTALLASGAPASYADLERSIAQTKEAMMGDPSKALVLAQQASSIAANLPPSQRARVAGATAAWLHAEALIFVNRPNEAAPIIDAALHEVERLEPRSKLHGNLLRSRGALESAGGRVLEALSDYQRAYDVFGVSEERRSQALTLQDIGSIYMDGGDYPRTIKYYDQSVEVFSDPALQLTTYNNRGEVYRKLKEYEKAASAYRSALQQARIAKSPMLQARILTNLAGSEAEAGHLDSAQAAIDQATSLSSHGETAGYQPFVFGVAAKIAFERGDASAAAGFLERTFANINLEQSEMLFREYHETAARVYERLGEDRKAFAHLKAFQRLDSEAQAATASAASQLIAARFDFANQDLKISKLKEGQLKRDVELERQKSETRSLLLAGLLLAGSVVVGLLLFGFLSIRRSRNDVRDANNSLSTANIALESALAAKTEFLATTSHEIRTPLNGILGMTQVLLQDRGMRADIRERIEVVHGAGETMRALVDDILDVAKMETGLLTVVREAVDLPAVLADASKLWSGQAQAKGVAVIIDIEAAPRRVMSDAGRLRQITFNLMSNAMKFTSAGEVRLLATTEYDTDGIEHILLRVSDTGIGIPADKLDTIFEPFRQVDGGITRQYGGTGLGLAIVRNLVHALGGHISVESVLGTGTSFVVRLPLERVADDARQGVSASASLEHASLLIVERDPARLGMLRLLLAAEVDRTDVVPDADAATAALTGGGITHVLADADMLLPTGNEAAAASLKTLTTAARDLGVHLTLLATAGRDAELIDSGATHIVAKPIDATGLIAALQAFYVVEQPEPAIAPARLAA